MTNDTMCTFGDRRDEVLIAFLYDDIDAVERVTFERHLAACGSCRNELAALSDVRHDLAEWATPDVADGIGGQAPRSILRLVEPAAKSRGWRVLAEAPVWMQAAAAMLVVAASLGLANINLSYTHDGLSVTTGWMRPAAVPTTPVAAIVQPVPVEQAPWRADLTALEQQLRTELATRSAPVSTPVAPVDEALMKRVRALVQDSERHQQSELALRVAEMARESQTQRQADLVRIERTLGVLQSRTGVEVMRTQQQLNSLAQRVSQHQ